MPSIAARTLCTTALELIGVASAEQPIYAVTAQRALQTLNTMLDAWRVDRLLTYTRPKIPLVLVPGRGTYTWGEVSGSLPMPDIALPPPVRLEICLLNIGGSPEQEWPLRVLTQTEYESGVWLKTLQSDYPEMVYLEASQPYAVLHTWYVPSRAYTLQLLPWQAHSPYESYDAVLDWPAGYQDAFEPNLAVRLAPFYGAPVSPELRQWAEDSKRALYPVNLEVGRLRLDPRRPQGGTALGLPRGFLTGRG